MDQKIGKAPGIDRSHRELFDAGPCSRNEAHATISNHARHFRQNYHVPMHVDLHEDSGVGRPDRNLSRNRRQNQDDNRRIFQVSAEPELVAIPIRFHC